MGQNKKKSKTSVAKQSSHIPTQEFVDKFTDAFKLILRDLLLSVEDHPNDFSTKVLKPLLAGGDVVKPSTFGEKNTQYGPVSGDIFHGILSVARAKARQQLDSLSSRYQNSLPSLAKKLQPQQNKKGKQKDQSNQHVSIETYANPNSLPELAKKLQPQQNKKGKQKDQSNQHVSIETYANPVIDKPMDIDEPADPSIAASQPNQEGNLRSTQSTSSTTTPIGTSPPNVITQSEDKTKKSKITRLTLTNNVVHDSQQGQVRTIMIYDIPTAWSHDLILNKLKSWGKVLEISFKPQHKYQSVWAKMILRPVIDTDFVMRTWWQKLDEETVVRWYPRHWKLKDRKERERFQGKIMVPSDAPDDAFMNYRKGQNFGDFVLKALKAKSWSNILDKGNKTVIVYFEPQKDLHNALEVEQAWKMTESHSPQYKRLKSNKDKKKNSKSLKGKKAEPKGSTSSIKSRKKSKKHDKLNDDTRSLLKLILNLLS
ncbi:hypothetical protein RhiirA4_476073 [Rhizophagus irregularis]|uniref:Uncharacterized protein n=1 Tax=Rhizophagus irregularis TaxID=588596 RepID=A0A2I1HB04_9GLOM|nr:hypothetical protein RhiirA4_476073 [Rhizophagus irregularis]